jgi:signal peptidase I
VDRRPALGCLKEIVETLVLTLVIFLVIQNFVAQPYEVRQNSMETTLEPHQYVLVDKLTPRFDEYKRGDIIVFNPPASWEREDNTPFIKRVIGLPGDTVEIRPDRFVYVNGRKIDEPYIYAQPVGQPDDTEPQTDQTTWHVGADELFVLGDHRSRSADSRSFGVIRHTDVIGRAFLRYWPLPTFSVLQTPVYAAVPPGASVTAGPAASPTDSSSASSGDPASDPGLASPVPSG